MKVVFTYYPLKVRYNHGVALLAELCRAKGIKSYIIPIDNKFFSMISSIDPDYVCFSFVCEHDYHASLPYVKRLRESDIKTLAGGVYCRRGSYIKKGLFDHICRGDGELLPYFFLYGKTACFNEQQEVGDISDLPLPDYTQVTGFEFDRGVPFFKGKKIIPYSSSRGCPYKCSFCEVQFQSSKIKIRTTIKEDMAFLHERYLPDMFYFLDELLPYYNIKWKEQMEGNTFPFTCYIRADIKESDLLFLINNGMTACAFGVESGDEEHRNAVLNKGLTNEELFRTVEILKDFDIDYIPFYMAGPPHETSYIKNKTEELIKEVGGYPMVWAYEDLNKKRFCISDIVLSEYAESIGEDKDIFIDSLDDPALHVESAGNGFLAYILHEDTIFIRDITGDLDWWYKRLLSLAHKFNKKKLQGLVKHREKAFNRRFGFNTIGHLIGKEVH